MAPLGSPVNLLLRLCSTFYGTRSLTADCFRRHSSIASAAVLLLVVRGSFARGAVDFNRDVRPILSSKCFKCHGPDEGNRQSGLRLDLQETAVGEADSGLHAIVPSKPEASELVRRIEAKDDADRMPPPASNLTLAPGQIEILKQWISQGAKYEPHWAFVPPQSTPPAVNDQSWPRNPIDQFVLASLEQAGMRPTPEADRLTLIRRVSLDLIGLPPTPTEADAFVNDTSPDAYERVVDRLLASPHYGERWARRWLDLARYADTNGYEKDRPRSIWPYRDWVIRAINADMPFDQFTIEQIAGDMLPNATAEQRVATGFHRNTMLNEEGGIDPQEFRFYSLVDRVNTTATIWLGLTLGCAQCHTHKFDPLTHREYYQMMAFLNNADEPDFDVPDPAIASRRQEFEAKIAEREAALADRFPLPKASPGDNRPEVERRRDAAENAFRLWLEAQQQQAISWKLIKPTSLKANLAKLSILEDGSVLASGDQTKRDVYELELPANDLRHATALRLEVLPHESLPGHGPGRIYYEGPKGNFVLNEFTLVSGGKSVSLTDATESFCQAPANGGKFTAAMAIDGQPQTYWSIDGGMGRAHQAVFRLAKPIEKTDAMRVMMVFEYFHAAALGRFRIWSTYDGRDIKAQSMPTDLQQLCLVTPDQLSHDQRQRLKRYYLSTLPELADARKEIDALRGQVPQLPTTLVMQERPADHRRDTHRHHRGEYLQPKEVAQPGVPSVISPGLAASPSHALNRLDLARWLVDARNPLVGRVTMNRHWAALFGRGLVRTTEDFGYQGEPPTHPKLLDWMAEELVRRHWSIKAMHRLIATSARYRQSSEISKELWQRDPENKLLARGPRVRLEAEVIRDQGLAACGLLSRKVGGPSVYPPQPASISSEGAYGALTWKVSEGEDRYRRGIYTFSKRTTPFAMFTTFDAPSGEVCVARRDVSNSPLQALTLLNDEVFVEAAQTLGRQLAEHSGTVEERMKTLFRRCLVRTPTDAELARLMKFYETERQRFASGKFESTVVASAGGGDANERAAWTVTARTLLNLDEMVTKE